MKRTVYHISKQLANPQEYFQQSPAMFPFLNSPLMHSQAKRNIRFKDIHALGNLRNIRNIVPHQKQCHEFVFFGRSNVGKSTLLNHLMQKPIAAVSKKPGKTKQLLFCQLASKRLSYLVDAPGYGYATATSKQQIKQWGRLITSYLKLTLANKNQRILCLLDVEHGLKQTDALLLQMLKDMKKNFILVFTKCDKIHQNSIKDALKLGQQVITKYDNMNFYTHFTSSTNHTGIDELRNHLMFELMSGDV